MAEHPSWSKEELKMLIEGKLPWELAKRMMCSPKDPKVFEKTLEILREKVRFNERILLPIGEHLYIVEKDDGSRVVKCDCGYEFGDYRINWKLNALIYVRNTEESLDFLYPGYRKPDPEWCEVREFYCPGCGAQLEVEALPPGYPTIFEFLPDIDGFYTEWLRKELKKRYNKLEDLTYEVTKSWLGKENSDGQ